MVAVPPRLNPARLYVALFGAIAIVAGIFMLPVSAQSVPNNALPFTRSYLLTGNYGAFGVDLPPQAADCATFAPDCYAKGAITVAQCPKDSNGQPVFTPVGGCIPEGADVVAAWMYWEALAGDPTTVPKARIRPGQLGTYSTVVLARRNDEVLPSQASCLSSAGTQLTLSMFSADVLRFFPIAVDKDGVKTGRRQVVGTHDIALPEVGNGNNARQGAGATLFFVYRLETEPLRKVVVYDGAYLQQPPGAVTTQQLRGFYQSWAGQQSAWVTNIVGSGARNTTERLLFSNADVANSNDVVATDLFPFPLGQGGNGSDRAWANPTIDVSGKMPSEATTPSGFGETVSLAIDHTNNSPYECLSWAAVIFSTKVKDADADGLPDALELENGGLKDPDPADLLNTSTPAGRPLPYLWGMGARVGPKDVFVEMNGFWTNATTRYGDATAPFSTILQKNFVDIPAHNHLPTPEVIKLMGDTLKSAPVPIQLHVDVGDLGVYKKYQGFGSSAADEYLISSGARGGEIIAEKFCDPNLQPNDPTPDPTLPNSLGCHFPFFPGTVGWRFGFEHYKGQPVDGDTGAELSAEDQDECYDNGKYTVQGNQEKPCRRRFDPIRAGLFHYFLYAHALGIPKGKPCLDSSGNDADFNSTVSEAGVCSTPLTDNPNYHVPRSTSGAGESPGGHGLITVGLWDLVNGVGSPFLVAATSAHEFGHNGDLSHGGRQVAWGNATTSTSFEPNCKPNYPSIMSYLFQIHGLVDLAGNARIDFSRGVYGDTGLFGAPPRLNEATLNDRFLLLPDSSLTTPLRTAWFVPVVAPTFDQNNNQLTPGNLAYTLGVQPANRYCTGAKISGDNPGMGRVDGPGLSATPTTTSLIDYDLNVNTPTATQDVNFDGPNGATVYQGYNDWANLRLNQIGGGKSPAGFSLGQGAYEFGHGGFDFGHGGFEFGHGGFDFGHGGFEFGHGGFDFGHGGFDFGHGGFDFGDGSFNFGHGGFDFGHGGFDFGHGGFDFGHGGFDFGNDITYDVVKQNGHTPPLSAAASVIQTAGTSFHRNRVTWNAPHVGTVAVYKVFRQLGETIDGSSPVEQLCSVNGVPAAPPPGAPPLPPCSSATSFTDGEELPNNQWFTYFVRAVFNNCNAQVEKCESGPSNFAKVLAQNSAPQAGHDPSGNQNFDVKGNQPLVIAAPGVRANDTDADSPFSRIRVAGITVQPTLGTLVWDANGSFTYTRTTGGSAKTDTFKYKADNGKWRNTTIDMSPLSNEATVTITLK